MHNRRSIRMKRFDYSQSGRYFITICTDNRVSLFGCIQDGAMVLNEGGLTAKTCWLDVPNHYPNVTLDKFIVMPNHVHGILLIENDTKLTVNKSNGIDDVESYIDQMQKVNKYRHIIPSSIGAIIRGCKTGVTKWFRGNLVAYNVWQRDYYEHLILNDQEYLQISRYIEINPKLWLEDRFYEGIQNPEPLHMKADKSK